MRDERAALVDDISVRGPAFGRAYAALVDAWLTQLLGDVERVALVAVGGYGRRELAPASDLDVLLLHDKVRDVDEIANRLWYPIWDAGFRLDHSVRTVREGARGSRRAISRPRSVFSTRAAWPATKAWSRR